MSDLDDLYDEFGNYIGPSSSEEEEEEEEGVEGDFSGKGEGIDENIDPEDEEIDASRKGEKYLIKAQEVYGKHVEFDVQVEDTQEVNEPIMKPLEVKSFSHLSEDPPTLKYSLEFLAGIMSKPELVRNVAVVGHCTHGKTTLCDALIGSVINLPSLRYTDVRVDEQKRGISIKACPVTLGLQDSRGKTFVVNLIDCPGHVNFSDEVSAGIRASDGVVVVVDAIEGNLLNTDLILKHAVSEGVSVMLCISKVDRLIHEVKLPPADAYLKLRWIIEHVNEVIETAKGGDSSANVCPIKGTVCFSSGSDGWCFTLQSFALLHLRRQGCCSSVNPAAFAKRLWGDMFYDKSKGKFTPKRNNIHSRRSFVEFVLEPLYKLYGLVLGEEPELLSTSLRKNLSLHLSEEQLEQDTGPLLKLVLSKFFGPEKVCGFVDMVTREIPSPRQLSMKRYRRIAPCWKESSEERLKAIMSCDAKGPLSMNIVKLFASVDGSTFWAFGKVFSGTVHAGKQVCVLQPMSAAGSDGSATDDAIVFCTIHKVAIPFARHWISVDHVVAGSWALIQGIDHALTGTCTLVDADSISSEEIGPPDRFLDLVHWNKAVCKLAIEPLHPADLARMTNGLRCVSKSYPLLETRVEESGEHVIMGTGELYLDCVMHDLRHMYTGIEVRVSEPAVSFSETIETSSAVQTSGTTPDQRNTLMMVAEPFEDNLCADIENGRISASKLTPPSNPEIVKLLQEEYGWDALASRSLWAIGPDVAKGNVLLDDLLPSSPAKEQVKDIRESLVQGFNWAVREGPLCDEPVRNVKFRLLDASVTAESVYRGAGMIVPTARRVAHAAVVTASPRLMEPTFIIQVQAPSDLAEAIRKVLRRRRGHITSESPIPGTPFTVFLGYLPVIDSYGFETDLRSHTSGLAFVQQIFDHWEKVPGDPLDDSIILQPLEPSRGNELAREFLIKTRRRKGLPEEVSISKYFDDEDLFEKYMRRHRQDEASSSGSSSSEESDE